MIGNTIWNFVGYGWMLVISFFAMPYIVRELKAELYGVYALVGVVVGYFAFLQLGIGSASVKYISEHLAKKDEAGARAVFWSCVYVYFFMGTLAAAMIWFLSPAIVSRVLKMPETLAPAATFALRAAGVGFGVSMITVVVSGVLKAAGRFGPLNRIGMVLGTLQTLGAVVLLKLGFSLKEIVVANVATQFLGAGLYWRYAALAVPALSVPSRWDTAVFVKMLKYGGFITVTTVIGPFLSNAEKLFLTALRSSAALTYYYVPFSVVKYLSVIPSSLASVLFPAYSFYQCADSGDVVNRELHFKSTVYVFFISWFPALFFIFFGERFLGLWMGEDFAVKSAGVLSMLSLAGVINATAYPSITAIQGYGKPAIPALFHAAQAVVYLPLAYFFVARFGARGAAAVWLGRVAVDAMLLQAASCRLLGVGLGEWYLRMARRIFLPSAAVASALGLLRIMNPQFLSVSGIGGILSIFTAYAVMVWFFGLDSNDKRRARFFILNFRGERLS
ncbi:MAG: hypothetical protein CVU77_01090 [Elusimicrobia bacterium HGW-Elusimicrobia-1]|jgi:O-antigen/teichoic acid export membrane protein|nr:MAG: hypothetical protein CVU77_01090 [Elusimicrobia bacterium HGW-Elusimicrobia-1]